MSWLPLLLPVAARHGLKPGLRLDLPLPFTSCILGLPLCGFLLHWGWHLASGRGITQRREQGTGGLVAEGGLFQT